MPALPWQILEQISDAFVVYDKECRYTYANKEALKIIGRKLKDLKGKVVWDLFPDFKDTESGQNLLEAAKTGKTITFQTYLYRVRRWFDIRIYPGKKEIIVNYRDITEMKQTEYEFASLASVVASNNNAIWSVSISDQILSWNQGAERLYGYKAEEVIGRPSSIVIPPDKRKEFKDNFYKIRHGNSVVNYESQRTTKKGSIIDVSVSMSPVKDFSGKIIATSVIAIDITRQKQIEQSLKASEERFRALIEQSTDVIQLINAEGKILYTSDSVKRVLGYMPEEILGHGGMPYLHPEDAPNFFETFSHLLEKPGKQIKLEYRLKHKDNSWVWIEATGVNHLNNPAVKAIVGNFRDITQRKLLERQKDEFLGIASHELKTPVTSLKAFTQILQNKFAKSGNEQSALLLGKMDAQINRLTNLIQDLLDISKVERDRFKLEYNSFNLDNLIEEVVEEIQRTAETNTIVIKNKTEKSIYADRERIGQVLTNFLTNAVKYSLNDLEVTVSTVVRKKDITICVEDFGIGIPRDQLPSVFDRFFRVSGEIHNTVPGMGLGLNIAAEIIKRHNGKIWAESEEGKGSRFYFTLPVSNHIASPLK